MQRRRNQRPAVACIYGGEEYPGNLSMFPSRFEISKQ